MRSLKNREKRILFYLAVALSIVGVDYVRRYWTPDIGGNKAWDRNMARAVLGRELPNHALFRYVQRVPNSTITHVSVSPPFHPARPDFPDTVGDHGISPSSLPYVAEA